MSEDTSTKPSFFNVAAFLLGWVFPGFGQWVLGRRRRALFIASGILGMVLMGTLVGGVDVVDRDEDRMWFIPQALVGPVVFAIDLANQNLLKTGRVGEIIAFDTDDRSLRQLPVNEYKSIGRVNELGTLFIALAGLMNLCVMFDAGTRAPGPSNERGDRRRSHPDRRKPSDHSGAASPTAL